MIESKNKEKNTGKISYLREEHIEKRTYQLEIAKKCESKNSLVVIPTGLGKTIIGVYVAALTLRNFAPESKILVLAPTRPLINQHYDSFKNLMTIPEDQLIVLTGKIPAEKRIELFETHQIIFYTPQTLRNDLVNLKYNLKNTCLIIFDEAHHATGDYAYTFIADEYVDQNPEGTILGLTASPGASKDKIRILCENLYVPKENIHTRTRKDVDVKSYLKPMDIYKVGVNLTELMEEAYDAVCILLEERLQYLSQLNFIDMKEDKLHTKIIRKDLLRLNRELTRIIKGDGDKTGVYSALSINAQGLILYHMLELIEQQGLDVLLIYLTKMKTDARKKSSSKALRMLASDPRINQIYIELKRNEDLSPKQLIHPKYYHLENLLAKEFKNNPQSRVLVFVKLRDSVKNIVSKLKVNLKGVVIPARFVGQSTKSRDDKGLSQKKQLELLDQFRKGTVNALISTNVGEEGLDIAECDLVVFYDVVASEIRFIQRKGRTARHREGKVIILYCKGTHDEVLMNVVMNKLRKMNVNLKNSKSLQETFSEPKEEIKVDSDLISESKKKNKTVDLEPVPAPKEKEDISITKNKKILKKKKPRTIYDQGQLTLLSYIKEPKKIVEPHIVESETEEKKIEYIKVSESFPIKFGLRKKLLQDGISFTVVKGIIHLRVFDTVMIQIVDPSTFEETSLLKRLSLLSKMFKLMIVIFDFVEFKPRFEGEERLLKQKVKEWNNLDYLQAITVKLPEELYFVVKNIYLHAKKEVGGK